MGWPHPPAASSVPCVVNATMLWMRSTSASFRSIWCEGTDPRAAQRAARPGQSIGRLELARTVGQPGRGLGSSPPRSALLPADGLGLCSVASVTPARSGRPTGRAGRAMTGTNSEVIRNHAAFIWSVADLLRGDYKQSEYGRVILPMVVLRRLDCVLEPTKARVLDTAARLAGRVANVGPVLRQAAGEQQFYNVSPLTMTRLLDDPPNLADNLRSYLMAFSSAAPRRAGEVRSARADRPARSRRPALPRGVAVLRDRPASRGRVQPGDGLPLRGTHPAFLRAVQRDGRRALHAPGGDPADGEPAVHRG